MESTTSSSASTKADHLCVLVHGLWGNPEHLKFLSTSLREKHSEDKLEILVAKRNIGSFTYDGIELGGERVASEVEEKLQELEKSGHVIKKISVIGYSLGGLIARYAIGLLHQKGVFEKIQPINFTTFATPHLGVRTPLNGYHSHLWNVLGARTLSMSGKQLFGIDSFRDTGRPLLAVLADPESIFIRALAQFKHRSLYANVVNDRTVTYYTAAISQTDPFANTDNVKVNYADGYGDVIVDWENPVSPKDHEELPAFTKRLTTKTRSFFGRIPITAFFIIFIPIGATLFLMSSAVETVRSRQRIRRHEEGKAGVDVSRYRIPLMINNVRQEVEDMFENVNNAQQQEYLPAGSEELASPTQPTSPKAARIQSNSNSSSDADSVKEQKAGRAMEFPTLALAEDQFRMIEALDNVGFKKYPVYIHNVMHTHAAIIVRMNVKRFEEGKIVTRHWLDHFVL